MSLCTPKDAPEAPFLRLSPQFGQKFFRFLVRNTVKDLDRTVDYDEQLMLEILHERSLGDPDYIIYDHDPSTSYYGGTENAYWSRFVPLRPKVEQIITAIRKFLGTS